MKLGAQRNGVWFLGILPDLGKKVGRGRITMGGEIKLNEIRVCFEAKK